MRLSPAILASGVVLALFGAGCSLKDAPQVDELNAQVADLEDQLGAAQVAAQEARLRFNELNRKIQNLPDAPSDLRRDADAVDRALSELEMTL